MKRLLSLFLVLALVVCFLCAPASAASTGNDVVSLMGAVEWNWRAYTGSTTYDSGSFYYGTIAKQSKGSKLAISCTLPDAISLIGGYDEIEVIIESSAASLPSMYINDTLTTYTKVGSRFYYSCSRSDLHATTMKLEFASMPSAYVQILDCRLSGAESCLNIGIYKGTSLSGNQIVGGSPLFGGSDGFFCFQARGDSFHFTATSTYEPPSGDWNDSYYSFACSAEVFDDGQFRDLPVYQISYASGTGAAHSYNIVIDLTDAPDDSKVVVHITSYCPVAVSDWYLRFNNTLDDERFFWTAWFQRITLLLSQLQEQVNPTDSTVPVDDFKDSSGQIDDFEHSQMDSIDSNMSAVKSTVSFKGITSALAFVQRYANGVFSGLGDVALLFSFPLFLGIFFYLCSRVPNNTHHKSGGKGGDD